jgi:hypothetical protein
MIDLVVLSLGGQGQHVRGPHPSSKHGHIDLKLSQVIRIVPHRPRSNQSSSRSDAPTRSARSFIMAKNTGTRIST